MAFDYHVETAFGRSGICSKRCEDIIVREMFIRIAALSKRTKGCTDTGGHFRSGGDFAILVDITAD